MREIYYKDLILVLLMDIWLLKMEVITVRGRYGEGGEWGKGRLRREKVSRIRWRERDESVRVRLGFFFYMWVSFFF